MMLLGYSNVGNIYQWHNFLVCQKTECGQTKMTHLFQCFFISVDHIFNLIPTAATITRIAQRTTRIARATRTTGTTRITRVTRITGATKTKRAIRTRRATRNDFSYGCWEACLDKMGEINNTQWCCCWQVNKYITVHQILNNPTNLLCSTSAFLCSPSGARIEEQIQECHLLVHYSSSEDEGCSQSNVSPSQGWQWCW